MRTQLIMKVTPQQAVSARIPNHTIHTTKKTKQDVTLSKLQEAFKDWRSAYFADLRRGHKA